MIGGGHRILEKLDAGPVGGGTTDERRATDTSSMSIRKRNVNSEFTT